MDRNKKTINFLLIIFVMSSIVIQVFLLNKHSTMGDQLSLINNEINEIEKDNNIISQQIASLSAMTTIAQRAKDYGLASSAEVLSFATAVPLAANLKFSL